MEFASAEALPQREPRAKRQKAAAAGGARHEEPGDAERAGTAVIGSGADASGAPKTGDQASIDLPEYRSAAVKGQAFEYLDHTADVQLHAWGSDLEEAFANAGLAMFNYMTPLAHVEEKQERTYEAVGHDMESLLFAFLDELLFVFHTELFVCSRLTVTSLGRGGSSLTVKATGRGERFDRSRHEAGTEVKAVTYSAMQIREAPGDAEIFVIVDI